MFRNYLLTALRHLARQKGFSFINIFGLALGLACSLMILLWVQDEISFDRFHANLEQIYRVEEDQNYNGEIYHVTVTPYPSGPVWRDRIPEIKEAVRVQWLQGMLFRLGDRVFFENGIRAVDSSFFRVFTFPLIAGDPGKALTEPHSMVVTEEIAEKYFGKEDPLGKTILVNGSPFTVTGVLQSIPENSSLSFDVLFPFDMTRETGIYSDHWGSNSINTFVQLAEHADPRPVDKKLTDVYKENLPEGTTLFMLAPLKRMHLFSYFGFDHKPEAIQYVYIFTLIAVFVLLIACINFMNLSTARATVRYREVGMRKVMGGRKINLLIQFYGEAVLMAVLAMGLAILIIAALMGTLNQIAGKELSLAVLLKPVFLLGMLSITLLAGFLAGTYPALMMSSLRTIRVLKGENPGKIRKGTLRKILVVVQFSLSVLLIVGTLVVFNQLNYMKNRELGYDKENLLYLGLRGDIYNAYERIRENFIKSPHVLGVSSSSHPPYRIGSNSGGAIWPGKPEDYHPLVSMCVVDYGFTETMKIEILEGRSFSRDFPSDYLNDSLGTGNFLINETMKEVMDLKEPVIGHAFSFMGAEGQIIGVMKDYHYQPVQAEIEPLAIGLGARKWHQYMLLRIAPGNIENIMKELEVIWDESIQGYPFEYDFVDEEVDAQYRSQLRMGKLLQAFSVVAIVVASLGLLGLASFMAERRRREFGIRKAMGSGASQLAIILTGDFTKLVGIALLIGLPSSWYLMNKWLQNYAYRTELAWWIFAGTAALCLLVAWITLAYHAWRVSRTNPADALRYE